MQAVATSNQYEVVKNFCGHGTGKFIHMDPLVRFYSILFLLTWNPICAVWTVFLFLMYCKCVLVNVGHTVVDFSLVLVIFPL